MMRTPIPQPRPPMTTAEWVQLEATGRVVPVSPAPPDLSERDMLRQFVAAIGGIEQDAICRCDLDCLAPSEEQRLRTLLGVLQDYARGYDEDGAQPRVSAVLLKALAVSPAPPEPRVIASRVIAYTHNFPEYGPLPPERWHRLTLEEWIAIEGTGRAPRPEAP